MLATSVIMNIVSAITLIFKPTGPAPKYGPVWWMEQYTVYSVFGILIQVIFCMIGLILGLIFPNEEYEYVTLAYGGLGLG